MHTHHQCISQVRRWNTELLLHFDLSHKLQLPVVIEFALNLRQFCKQLLQHLLAYRFFVETQHVVGVCILTVNNRPICQIQPVSQRVIELRSLIAEHIANMAACALDDVNQFNYANMLDDLAQKIRKGVQS